MNSIFLKAKLSRSFLLALSASIIISTILRNPFYSVLLGGDTKGLGGYQHNYNRITDWDSLGVIYYYNDYLFSTFAYVLSSWQVPVNIYLFLLAFFSTLFLFLAYKNIIFSNYKKNIITSNYSLSSYKKSYLIFLSALIFVLCSSSFYLFAVNALRQFLAISIFLYGISIWFNQKPKLASLIIFISIFAHTSSLFLVIFFYLSLIFSIRQILFISGLMTLSSIFLNNLISYELIISQIEWIDEFPLFRNFANYIIYKIQVLKSPSTGVISVDLKLMHAFCFSFFAILISLIKEDYIFKSLSKMYFIFVFFCFMISGFEAMTNRFLLYTGVLEPLLLAYSIFYIKKSQMVSVVFILNTLAIFYLAILLLFHPSIKGELMLSPQPIGGYKHGLPDPMLGKFINPTY